MSEPQRIALPVALLAAASGARSMAGIAAVARSKAASERGSAGGPRVVRKFDDLVANTTTVLAAFELMADKAPHIPDRIDPGPLLARVVAGAVVGASVARSAGVARREPAIGGALVAFVAAHVSYRLRRALARDLPAFAAGLVEDAVVIGIAAAGLAFIETRSSMKVSGGPVNS
jgi:uncharacterized membrane protein